MRDIGIDGETDPGRYVAARTGTLHERLTLAAGRAARGELDGVEIEDGKLFIARTPPVVPEAARDLALRLNGMLPRALSIRWSGIDRPPQAHYVVPSFR